jgi:hypothetical protein
MPLLILLTVVFAAVGVFLFLVIGLMALLGLNGMSSADAAPWLWGLGLALFFGYNLLAAGLLSFISRRTRAGPRWHFAVAFLAMAVAFVLELGLFVLCWNLF